MGRRRDDEDAESSHAGHVVAWTSVVLALAAFLRWRLPGYLVPPGLPALVVVGDILGAVAIVLVSWVAMGAYDRWYRS